ncbi:MAG: radical SAM protein [Planctomycetes bacterium]|nr:radical SAM protein [Planctomycetota bacterium]
MATESAPKQKKTCHLGWHITSRCNLSCKHCLRRTPGQATKDLGREECLAILESFLQFTESNDRSASIQFSGGNPLLRDDFPELLEKAAKAKRRGIVKRIQILGNPETLDAATISHLKECDIDDITISMDGLEETNDRMRGKGNFKAALNGIRNLMKAGVPTSMKFTLVRDNAEELKEVIKLALGEGINHIGIGHLILAGGAIEERNRRMSPMEYRDYLISMMSFLDTLPEEHAGFRRSFLSRNSLYPLLFHELGRLEEYRQMASGKPNRREGGPGGVMFVVWSDGEVVPRREMQRQGYVPGASFQEIYDSSPLIKLMEDKEYIRKLSRESMDNHVKCSVCPVREFCSHGMAGISGYRPYFAPNRDCWCC